MTSSNAKTGFILFCVYLVLYGSFVLLNAFAPETMEITFSGVNFAILSGFGLIIAALVLSLIYGFICKNSSDDTSTGEGSK